MFIRRLGRVETQELGELAAVLGVFVNTKLDVFAKRFVELGKVVLVLSNLAKEFHALFHDVLADDLENLVLLEGLTRDVQREILRIDNTLDEIEVLRNEVLTVVHDEDPANVELDVVALLLGFEEIERGTKSAIPAGIHSECRGHSPFRDEKNSLELELTLDREVLHSEMVFPVVS